AEHNFREISRIVGHRPVIAVIKADAYGHGAIELARTLVKAGAYALAVAFVSEAQELRSAGIDHPLLVLFDRSEIPQYFDLNLTPVLHDLKTARKFSDEAQKRGVTLNVHVKADTGMGRMGTLDSDEIFSIASLPGLHIAGFMSHFSEADIADPAYVELQLERFHAIREKLAEKGITPLCHMANSAAVLAHEPSHMDAVRPGLVLYGSSPFEQNREDMPSLKPVMKVTTTLLTLKKIPQGQPISYGRTFIPRKDMLAAIVPTGYADGYSRTFSNNADVLIKGKRVPVVGRVCMDLTVVDVTDIPDVTEGDTITLLGQDGPEHIDASELAKRVSTIAYEILCLFGRLSHRNYHGGSRA
ncbi:MAG: alanine racemase, partial [Desulfobacterales bacterium]|nr:alanine racemase [Desulfobacterales bacterium]